VNWLSRLRKLTEIIAALARVEILEALILVHQEQFARKLEKLTALYRLLYPDENDPNYTPMREMLNLSPLKTPKAKKSWSFSGIQSFE